MAGFPVVQGVCLGCGAGVLNNGEHIEERSPCFGRTLELRLVTTHKRQFVHLLRDDGKNTACGAQPDYYGGMFRVGLADPSLVAISISEAQGMHNCKRCFPERQR